MHPREKLPITVLPIDWSPVFQVSMERKIGATIVENWKKGCSSRKNLLEQNSQLLTLFYLDLWFAECQQKRKLVSAIIKNWKNV